MGLTAQSYLKELYMELKFGIRKDFINKFVEKGLSAEDDSIALIHLLRILSLLKTMSGLKTTTFLELLTLSQMK